MIFLYGGVLVTALVMVLGTAKTVQVINNNRKALMAPPSEKQRLKTTSMRKELQKEERALKLLKDRFTLDFGNLDTTSEGNKVIRAELLLAKKDLARAGFKIAAHSTNTDASFCKELAKDFGGDISKARARIKTISRIWSDSY